MKFNFDVIINEGSFNYSVSIEDKNVKIKRNPHEEKVKLENSENTNPYKKSDTNLNTDNFNNSIQITDTSKGVLNLKSEPKKNENTGESISSTNKLKKILNRKNLLLSKIQNLMKYSK